MLGRMYASPQLPCSNVFCKKKQLEHYHCIDCGAAFNKVTIVNVIGSSSYVNCNTG